MDRRESDGGRESGYRGLLSGRHVCRRKELQLDTCGASQARCPGMLQHAANADIDARAAKAGLRFGDKSVHTSRTIMFAELRELLAAVPPEAVRADYVAAIVDENVLGKATIATRRWTGQRLGELYALDQRVPIFRVLRRLWPVDVPGRPLLAMLWRAGARSAAALDGAGRARFAGRNGTRQVGVPG